MNNQWQFFYSHSTIDTPKKTVLDKSGLQRLQFLILLMQIIYFFSIQWIISNLHPNQTQIIKNISVICNGILILLTFTIYLIYMMKHELSVTDNINTENKHNLSQ
jgi:hypothetical protein